MLARKLEKETVGRVSANAQMAVFTPVKHKMSKTSKFFRVITVSNELRPKYQVRMKVHVPFRTLTENFRQPSYLTKQKYNKRRKLGNAYNC